MQLTADQGAPDSCQPLKVKPQGELRWRRSQEGSWQNHIRKEYSFTPLECKTN